jgi:hypothetical protein
MEQVALGCDPTQPKAGRVLTMAAAQRATLHGLLRRWEGLPASWRASVPELPMSVPRIEQEEGPASPSVEREVIAGVLAAPSVLTEIDWLSETDFSDPRCAELFGIARRLWAEDRCVDAVTVGILSESADPADRRLGSLAGGAADVFPASVPFLARRVAASAAVRQALGVGRDLVAMAGAPASVGGIGAVQLRAALDRLDELRPYAERLEQAHRRQAPQTTLPATERRGRAPVPVVRAVAALDRRTG